MKTIILAVGLKMIQLSLKNRSNVLPKQGELNAYLHTGFWQCMDTIRDESMLEELWQTGKAPWKVWE